MDYFSTYEKLKSYRKILPVDSVWVSKSSSNHSETYRIKELFIANNRNYNSLAGKVLVKYETNNPSLTQNGLFVSTTIPVFLENLRRIY